MTILLVAAWLAPTAHAQSPARPAEQPRVPLLGSSFQSKATQAQQADDGTNPAMLWVEHGQTLWTTAPSATAKPCAACHNDATQSMRGVAARYPQLGPDNKSLLNIEGRINRCRTVHQSAAPLAYESRDLLGFASYIALQSRGLPYDVKTDGAAKPFFETGRQFFMTRQGQLNVSCAQCHDDNVGRKLRGDTISQGQPGGWPGYRFEWQSAGSLHRRLRACSLGVRAEILDYGAPEYLALELYLAWRAKDLPLEAPGVRR